MNFIIGLVVGIGCTLTGYILHHGKLYVLYQPTEYIIIFGLAAGSFVVSNPPGNLKHNLKVFKSIFKSRPYKKQDYLDILKFQFVMFKLAKTKGMLQLEAHIENPEESTIFSEYPSILKDHHITDFICDYMRLLTMGVEDKYVIGDMMEAEIEDHAHHNADAAGAWVTLGDAFPAIGIVAAVLGVIITMGSISEPPEVLGKLIGAALVGTFFGIFVAYGVVGPIGKYIEKFYAEEKYYYVCIQKGIVSFLDGASPQVCVEVARKVVPSHLRPSFSALEEYLG